MVRIASDLTRDRTRLVNRARQQLWCYFPQLLNVESELAKAWIRELRSLVPTPDKMLSATRDDDALIESRAGCA